MPAATQHNPYLDEIAFTGEKVRLGEKIAYQVCDGGKPAANDCCVSEKVRLAGKVASGVRYDLKDLLCHNRLIANSSAKPASAKIYYLYDEAGQLIGEYDQNGNALYEVIWYQSTPIAVIKEKQRHYVQTDHLNTPRAITNQNGTVVWEWNDPGFGEQPAQEDPDQDGTNFAFNLRFAGQQFDAESGLHYNYFRYYDPSTGRYLTSDPPRYLSKSEYLRLRR